MCEKHLTWRWIIIVNSHSLTHWWLRDVEIILRKYFDTLGTPVNLVLGERHRIPLVISQHRLMLTQICVIRPQWVNAVPKTISHFTAMFSISKTTPSDPSSCHYWETDLKASMMKYPAPQTYLHSILNVTPWWKTYYRKVAGLWFIESYFYLFLYVRKYVCSTTWSVNIELSVYDEKHSIWKWNVLQSIVLF